MRVVPFSLPVAALSLLGSSLALPAKSSPDAHARADAVKAAFQHAWDGYKKYAFPHDELHPVSDGYGDSRNGWGASAVDALSTAVVMGNADVVNQILDYIPTIDYSQTSSQVSLFETNIRYLAGMLAGYDLLKGPLAGLAKNESNVDALLVQAQNLANVLKYAFNTPSGIPYNNLYVTTQTTDGSTSNGLATTGSLVLEWTRLSDLLGDSEYANLTQRAESHLLHPQPPTAQPFPGLVGTNININTGLFEDGSVSWGGGDDSFYEYLMKMYVYDPTRFAEYKNRWVAAAESTMKHLASHPSSRPDLTFLATYNNGQYGNNSQHLTCFDGGSFLLGGSVLGRQDFIDFGLALVDGCYDTYKETATGIGPEQFSWDTSAIPADQQAFYDRAGFYITSGAYILRPEVLESIYYAYQITGNQKYRDWSWDAFKAINNTCWTPSGYAGLNNVNAQNGGGFIDNQESFFFAEVLKYSFLIHAPDEEYQVKGDGHNLFVFNTEAHPLRVANVARKA